MLTAHTFLAEMMADYPADNLSLEIRPLHPTWREGELYPEGNPPAFWQAHTPSGIRQWFPLTEQGKEAAAKHATVLSKRYEVYYGVLPRFERGGSRQDVHYSGYLWCDVDGGEGTPQDCLALVLKRVRAGLLAPPDMIVQSGGGCHFYWRLAEIVRFETDADRADFKALLKRLVKAINGEAFEAHAPHADTSRADTASIMRIPGTLNNKQEGNPRLVQLLHHDASADPLSYADWLELLPPPPPDMTPKRDYPAFRPDMPDSYTGLLRWASEGYPEGKRHQDLTGAAAWLVRDVGVPKTIAAELLQIKASNSFGGRKITQDELEAMISWA